MQRCQRGGPGSLGGCARDGEIARVGTRNSSLPVRCSSLIPPFELSLCHVAGKRGSLAPGDRYEMIYGVNGVHGFCEGPCPMREHNIPGRALALSLVVVVVVTLDWAGVSDVALRGIGREDVQWMVSLSAI
jgi:hypothetical protein